MIILLAIFLLLAPPAQAEVTENLEGIEAFKAHDYAKAEQLFGQALSKSTDAKEQASISENLALVKELTGKAPKDKSLPLDFEEKGNTTQMVRNPYPLPAHFVPGSYGDQNNYRGETPAPHRIDDYQIRHRLEAMIDNNLSVMQHDKDSSVQMGQVGSTAVELLPNGLYQAKTRVLLQDSKTAESLTQTYVWTYRVNPFTGDVQQIGSGNEDSEHQGNSPSTEYHYYPTYSPPTRIRRSNATPYGQFGDGHSWYK